MPPFFSYVAIVLGIVVLIAVVPGLMVEIRNRGQRRQEEEAQHLADGIEAIKSFDDGTTASLERIEVAPPSGRHGSHDVAAWEGPYEPLHAAPEPALDSATFIEQEARRRSLFHPTALMELSEDQEDR